MSRVFSFRDLLRCPEFAGKNEIDLLGIEMDAAVNHRLSEAGFNVSAAIYYVPSKHRDLTGAVGVGFRAVGEIDASNRDYLNSPLSDPIERLIAASSYDLSLTKELSRMMGSSINWSEQSEDPESTEFPEELIEPDFPEVAREILVYENIRDTIRGEAYNEAGALKTPKEYAYAARGDSHVRG